MWVHLFIKQLLNLLCVVASFDGQRSSQMLDQSSFICTLHRRHNLKLQARCKRAILLKDLRSFDPIFDLVLKLKSTEEIKTPCCGLLNTIASSQVCTVSPGDS